MDFNMSVFSINEAATTYTLRRATTKDEDTMYDMEMDSISPKQRDEAWIQKAIRDDVKESVKDTQMIVIGDDKSAGMLTQCSIDGGAWWYIGEIFLKPEYRGSGLGTKILKDIMSKHTQIKLQVSYTNTKAQKLYKPLGFEQCDDNKQAEMFVYSWRKHKHG